MKVSRSLKQVATRAKGAEESLFFKLGREPTIQEISDEIGVDKEEIVMALEASYNPEYLYDVIHQNDGSPLYLIDKISNETDGSSDMIDNLILKDILNKLNPRDKQIILLRYFRDKTQSEVAELFGISQVQVSRIEKKIIEEMRKNFKKA